MPPGYRIARTRHKHSVPIMFRTFSVGQLLRLQYLADFYILNNNSARIA
jgi:hypothetical protein